MKNPDHKKNPNKNIHPDIRTDAPGRIPESLINAAIDGELNEDIQREIAHALNYDPIRKQELLDTSSAINALQMPIATPDFADAVLVRADRHRKFIPASWRKHVRTGRLGIAAALLLTLMTVAGLQSLYPRLTTLAAHPTPVHNIEQAVGQDADEFASCLTNEARAIYANVASPIAGILQAPGRNDQSFEVSIISVSCADSNTNNYSNNYANTYSSKMHLVAVGNRFATVFTTADQDAPLTIRQSPLRLFATSNMGSWVYNTPSTPSRFVRGYAPHPNIEIDSTELDVPALP